MQSEVWPLCGRDVSPGTPCVPLSLRLVVLEGQRQQAQLGDPLIPIDRNKRTRMEVPGSRRAPPATGRSL
ncbi:hypothetical protein EYF80_065573 [Liparis tanakae]|uniref:Uncharacterized protein n=1 Tax=Liparis tanakae TaxID=230148 RepID=A0A4Z2E6V0_9TELE|nr:hypothetical protein EYF80_065573 [Liparis tanakae]